MICSRSNSQNNVLHIEYICLKEIHKSKVNLRNNAYRLK